MTTQPSLFASPPRRVRGRVTDGLEHTINALRTAGRLEACDAVWVALAREACAQYQVASRDPDVSEFVRDRMLAGALRACDHLPIGASDDPGTTLGDMLLAAVRDTADTEPAD